MASSRLRSFNIFNSASWKEYQIVFNPGFLSIRNYKYIHIQKMYKPRFICIGFLARFSGNIVIFDIDDQVNKISHKMALFCMIILSNFVITDTEVRKQYLFKKTRKKKIFVIPDVVDINFNLNKEETASSLNNKYFYNSGESIILWVGNIANFNSFKTLIESDNRLKEYKIIIITNKNAFENISFKHPNYEVIQWTLNWIEELNFSNRYFMILNHFDPHQPSSFYKSENKMVTALYNSIIPIVSNSPAYSSLCNKLDSKFLLFEGDKLPFDVINSLNEHDSEWFKIFFSRSQVFIDDHYSSSVISKKLLNLMNL